MANVFDMRGGNMWGRSIETQWGSDDPLKVQGCLTPLPQVGDFSIDNNAMVHRFIEVKHMGNPKDLFFATLESTNIELDKSELPTWQEINDFAENSKESK